MNDAVFSARDVTKGSTYRVNAFEGREVGPLGFADADGNIVYYHKPARPHTTRSEFDVDRLTMLPQTDIVISYVGAGGLAVDALVAGGAEGIVSASTGAGFPTPDETEALIRARSRGVVICIASRVGSGRVVQGREMRRRDFVTAGNLPPWKARVLLSLALTGTRDVRRIQRIFDRY
jgi:L-asparaginase